MHRQRRCRLYAKYESTWLGKRTARQLNTVSKSGYMQATKNNTLAQRNANVANPRFAQTQQVGVDEETNTSSSVTETLRLSD